ncbi:hypothetical protein [Polyangium aurulentum]|uniref:hypothetical protein n=1 Tax=Polyangium aurulentum TaxID=2567896 RepID=UPI0010ADF3D2|nr:hypothetical protein [Polyangium aurulentum]UQA60528.1 hypothetical protein E8A73_008665 [Polyangium aurulentum]
MKKAIIVLSLLSLQVVGVGTLPARAAPAHSFEETCWDWKWKPNGDLCATCRKRNGRSMYSCLPNARACRGDISNQNGRLTC